MQRLSRPDEHSHAVLAPQDRHTLAHLYEILSGTGADIMSRLGMRYDETKSGKYEGPSLIGMRINDMIRHIGQYKDELMESIGLRFEPKKDRASEYLATR